MDHIRILRRAFEIVRSYRVLWIFGFLLALTTSNGGGGSNSGYQFNGNNSSGDNPFRDNFPTPNLPEGWQSQIIGLVIGLVCLVVALVVIFTIVHYVSKTAAIRMVDRYEASGEKVRFRECWRLGWSRSAFRMWLVDLIIGLGGLIVFLLLFAIAAAPMLLWLTRNDVARVIGVVATVGLGVLVVLLLILVGAALSLLGHFFHRAIALEGLGVFDSIRRGWQIVRGRPWDVIIMGLILFGIGLVFFMVMIPILLLVVAVAGVIGGVPALLAGVITNLFAQGFTPWLVALIVGLPLFILVFTLPLTFINGLMEAFYSSTWTLTYREVIALEMIKPAEA